MAQYALDRLERERRKTRGKRKFYEELREIFALLDDIESGELTVEQAHEWFKKLQRR